ncbi:uncharacterized protein LOC117225807 [Megalopta genalis]|uniref:uncharacterized protein LOC117225807 n=1 Tax=Megalopta genalis TaxID=115081 RepID=UPI001443038E|nr:defensin-2-like [Megalopta genalis]
MKLLILFGVLCLAAVAVTSASVEKVEGQEEHDLVDKVEDVDNVPVVQPYLTCQLCGNTCCRAHCKAMGKTSGSCNKNDVCICHK